MQHLKNSRAFGMTANYCAIGLILDGKIDMGREKFLNCVRTKQKSTLGPVQCE